MQRAHKIRLVPNKTQLSMLFKTAGTARYAYNQALRWNIEQYEAFKQGTAEKPDIYSIARKWTAEKPDWAKETCACAQTQAILNLKKALNAFWNKKTEFPSFKKKGNKQSFYVQNSKGAVKGNKVRLPNIGWVKMREEPRHTGKIMAFSVSQTAGQWHVSIQTEIPDVPKTIQESTVGIDVGVSKIAVASDGTVCENPHKLKKQQQYLRRIQRKLARQVKSSNRRKKTKQRIAKTHLNISNARHDVIHKFTSTMAKNHGLAVIETLDIREMFEQGKTWMNRQLQDTAMREVHRQLDYKMGAVIRAPRYFPSSKRCSACGHVKPEFPCSIRIYKCEKCRAVFDRDLNAAFNLSKMPWVTGLKCVEPQ